MSGKLRAQHYLPHHEQHKKIQLFLDLLNSALKLYHVHILPFQKGEHLQMQKVAKKTTWSSYLWNRSMLQRKKRKVHKAQGKEPFRTDQEERKV